MNLDPQLAAAQEAFDNVNRLIAKNSAPPIPAAPAPPSLAISPILVILLIIGVLVGLIAIVAIISVLKPVNKSLSSRAGQPNVGDCPAAIVRPQPGDASTKSGPNLKRFFERFLLSSRWTLVPFFIMLAIGLLVLMMEAREEYGDC